MSDLRTNSGVAVDLQVELNRDSPVPLHRQLENAVRSAIRSGELRGDASLPPTRTLAAALGVSRGVVVEAYQQLTAEGYLTSQSGGYTRVRPGLHAEPAAAAPPLAPPAGIDFKYCRPDVTRFPRTAWLRSVRRVLNETPDEALAYGGGRGAPELRVALADYLNRARGTTADPENVLVCNGFTQAVTLLSRVLAHRGTRRMAVEDPSDPEIHAVPSAAGIEVVGIPVTPEGIDVDALVRSDADAVLLTPAHQCPTGAVLPAGARAAVLDWARQRGALVIEDDYDTEYRYDRAPIGAMQGLAPDHVVYAGTASKTLMPGLRLGWLVAPLSLVEDLTAAKEIADRGSPVFDQLAFADFLARGELDRHLRRMRPVYRRRRDALLDALRTLLPDLRPTGISAGLHLAAWLPPDLDETEVVAAAAHRGLRVHGLGPYRLTGSGDPGLIFGYASLTEPTIAEGIAILADVIATLRSTPTAAGHLREVGRDL
ncbi:MAG TPA: PLP-dependent aminotransferase family protein [Acidimicrobiales bacterium]|nr:PLP-dependent aminotransferase family protein [Acidimicrobiales bacterium]